MLVPHLMEIVEEDCLVYAITFHISSTEVNYSCQNIIQHDWLSSHQLSEWPWSLCRTHKPPVKTAVAASLVRVILKGILWIGDEALAMMSRILYWVREDDSGLGREKLAGNTAVSSLAVPMMLLCLIDQLTTMDPALTANYDETEQWCLKEVNKHVQRNGSVVLENVTPDGKELPGSAGRLLTPGHAIEAGWFLLQRAKAKGDKALQTLAVDTFITSSFQRGWDPEFGGIFYFLDVDGESPVQLEWDMKLWWVHNETLIAWLMAYRDTGDKHHLDNFATVFDYCYSHFVDTVHGDWYGYLNRRGEVTHKFKGGPWKGFFHLPRCLMMCEKMLEELIKQKQ